MQTYHLQNRPDREITDKSEIDSFLKKGKFATIAMCKANEPYIVTLSYGFDATKNVLYFHCAPTGLKLDFIKANSLVCATIIEDGGYVINECAHNFKSVILWGKMSIIDDLSEKKHGMSTLLNHLETDSALIATKLAKSDNYYPKMTILKLKIEQIHAKAGK